jgi:hypothetical protein
MRWRQDVTVCHPLASNSLLVARKGSAMYVAVEYLTLLVIISVGGLALFALIAGLMAAQEGLAWIAMAAPRTLRHLTAQKLLRSDDELKNSLPNTPAHSH